jgi:NDP-sugar pyrophosphorylase family protein
MPAPGFQAIILCGPGSSFPTFTANPDENPKALIPIANRPMVWYPIDFCYRMGVTSELILFIYACGLKNGLGNSDALVHGFQPWLRGSSYYFHIT